MSIEINDTNIQLLVNLLERTLIADAAKRKQAESELFQFKGKVGYGILLLRLIQLDKYPVSIRQAAATLFKNYIKQCWEETLTEAEKKQIREILPPFMLSVPKALQKLISASLIIISDIDFPQNWPELLPGLISHLQSSTDFVVINGILKVLNSTFKRFRHEFGTDPVLGQLKYILDLFAVPLLNIYNVVIQQIEVHASNPQAQVILFTSLKLICNIYYSLNAVDLPCHFEDNLPTWIGGFLKYLAFEPKVSDILESDNEDNPALFHKTQACIIANGNLYIEKYEEEFQPYLPQFVTVVWFLLMKTPNKPRFDPLVTSAIHFLTTVSRSTCYKLFEPSNILTDICKHIIVPNIKLRKSDIFAFDDDPMDYIRKDMEGSDTGTRRRSAYELVKGLRKNFEKQVTDIIANDITEMLKEHSTNPSSNWTSKDAAIYLLTALAVTRASASEGVTTVNQLVPIRNFYVSQVLPELNGDLSQLPQLKASCLNFINSFRRQFTVEDFQVLLPIFVRCFAVDNVVISSYAAICFDRFLLVKDKDIFRFGRNLIQPQIGPLLTSLFQALKPQTNVENHYLMKAIARVFSIAKEDVLPYCEMAMGVLNCKMEQIYKAPANPEFGYYLFECIAQIISLLYKTNPNAVDNIESKMFPVFAKIVMDPSADVFSPFVFQLLAFLLELRQGSLPDFYKPLLKELTSPIYWEQQGNVPALTRLIQAYITSGPDFVVSSHLLLNILGVFQKLISSKVNDYLGFYILESIVQKIPVTQFTFALKDIFQLIFIRLQGSKTTQLIKGFIVFLSVFIGLHGTKLLIQTMSEIQPGIFAMVLQKFWLTHAESIKGNSERKACVIGMIKLTCECPEMLQSPYVESWPLLIKQIVNILEQVQVETVATPEDQFNTDEEHANYTTGFSTLHHAYKVEVDPFKSIDSVKTYFVKNLSLLLNKNNQIQPLLQMSDPTTSAAIQKYFQSV